MSTAANDELPPFAQPYLADFQQLARMLERIPGFLLQPIEAPTPDLAKAFADWLGHQGWNVRLHKLRDADALRDLSAKLVQPTETTSHDVVLVVQSGALDEPAAHSGFAALNMARDSIAHASPKPLLWWGSSEFMRTTWSHAPDWWSVAATPLRIPFRSLHDLPSHLPLGTHWWTGAVNVDLGSLEEAVTAAHALGDPAQMARSGLQLAEAQLSRRDRLGARATLATIQPSIVGHAKALRPRWNLLEGAADADDAADAGISIEELRAQIAAAEANGAQHSEVRLRLQLAERLESGGKPLPEDALREYVRARWLTISLGDIVATLAIDSHIALDLAPLTDDPLRAELDRYAADAVTRTEDPISRARAALTRAKLALMSQAFDASEAFAQEAINQGQLADEPVMVTGAHCLLAACSFLRGDFSACLDQANTCLAGAEAADNLQLQLQARALTAQAHAALGDPRTAASETVELWAILPLFDQHDWLWCVFLAKLAGLALQTGDPAIAANFAALSVACHLAEGRLPDRAWLAIDLQALATNEPVVARTLERVFEITDYAAAQGLDDSARAQLDEAWEALHDETMRLDEALDETGVEAFDPDTWRGQ